MYFVNKNLAFGSSISCAIFQKFSYSLAHIFEFMMGGRLPRNWRSTNYLDDFLFMHTMQEKCNEMVRQFAILCKRIGVPVVTDKTKWGATSLKFLGIVIDGARKILMIPKEKRKQAIHLIRLCISKKKATVGQLQSLAGLLNFFNKAVHPGRTFTHRMYAKFAGHRLQKFDHISLHCSSD